MGGYLLLNIEFPSRKDRDKFEKIEKIKRMFQYSALNCYYDCFYYPVWMGYAEPRDIIQKCRKNKIKINKFLSIDLSTNGSWFDELKEKTYQGK